MRIYYNNFMKGQDLNQSRVFINGQTNRSDLVQDDIQFDNPENNFQKLLSIPPDAPAKQYRNLLQSMSQHCSFQKNIIKKTFNIQVPRYVKTEIKRKQIFEDYETIKNYASFSKRKGHFQNRRFNSVSRTSTNSNTQAISLQSHQLPNYGSHKKYLMENKKNKKSKGLLKYLNQSSKQKNLSHIVQNTKNKMLLENNILKMQQQKVQNILNDINKRQKIFQQALFLQRLYDIQIKKLKDVGVSQNGGEVPQKFKGVEPRHIRISSQACVTQQQYLRKKYVCKKRKLQFYGHAQKIEQSSLRNKKIENLDVIKTIMKFNQSKCATEGSISDNFFDKDKQKSINIFQQDLKLKRLFLKYTCSQTDNPQEMFKYIGQKQLNQFFKDFSLQQMVANNLQLQQFLQKKKQQKGKLNTFIIERQRKIKYFLFDFLQILYSLASQNNQNKQNGNLSSFLQKMVWSKYEKVTPQHWIKLKKIKTSSKMIKFMKILKFQQNAKNLFQKKVKLMKRTQFSIPLLVFNDLLEIAWEAKLFPIQISKKSLRFLYLYCISQQNGLNQDDFVDLLLVAGLKFSPQKQIQQKIKWISNQMFQ